MSLKNARQHIRYAMEEHMHVCARKHLEMALKELSIEHDIGANAKRFLELLEKYHINLDELDKSKS